MTGHSQQDCFALLPFETQKIILSECNREVLPQLLRTSKIFSELFGETEYRGLFEFRWHKCPVQPKRYVPPSNNKGSFIIPTSFLPRSLRPSTTQPDSRPATCNFYLGPSNFIEMTMDSSERFRTLYNLFDSLEQSGEMVVPDLTEYEMRGNQQFNTLRGYKTPMRSSDIKYEPQAAPDNYTEICQDEEELKLLREHSQEMIVIGSSGAVIRLRYEYYPDDEFPDFEPEGRHYIGRMLVWSYLTQFWAVRLLTIAL
jgi:hypothetical protein